MMVVSVPDPAITGNAMGTIVADFTSFSLLKNYVINEKQFLHQNQ